MKFTVIGAGAIGGTIGAHLVRDGHDVVFCDTEAAHVAAINERGLHVSGPVGDFVAGGTAVTPDGLDEEVDGVVLVAVKAHHTESVAALLVGRLAPDAVVVTIQNGLTADVLAPAVGRDRLVASFVNFGADYLAPGEVMQGNIGTFRIGELDGTVSTRVVELADALPYAEATDNILGYLWAKEAYGAMLFAGAVSDLSIADSLDRPAYRPLMLAIADEVLVQAPVSPMPFDGFEPDDLPGSLERLVTFNRSSAKSHSGIYRDLAVRKRRTEVAVQIDTLRGPLTNYVADLVRAIERGDRVCEVANLELLATYERMERIGRRLDPNLGPLTAPARSLEGPLVGTAVAIDNTIAVAEVGGTDAAQVSALRTAGADIFVRSSEASRARALVDVGVCPAALTADGVYAPTVVNNERVGRALATLAE